MSMFSHPIDVQTKEVKPEKQSHRHRSSPPPFPKKSGKKRLSKELEQGTLNALKELLARQKQKTDTAHEMSAAGPFGDLKNLSEAIQNTTSQRIEALDPSAQVTQLYDKLVETLIFVQNEGIQETTLILDSEAFSSSVFQGAQITITEYSTAPKLFNIQFTADPRALSLFEAHAGELMNALQQGRFGFGVHRLDTSLLTEDDKRLIDKVKRDLDNEKEDTQ